MQPKSLESFVRHNRDAFDKVVSPPTQRIWQQVISHQKDKPNQYPWGNKQILGIAATLIFLISLGLWFSLNQSPQQNNQFLISSYFPELAQQEHNYIQMVNLRKTSLQIDHLDKKIYSDVFQELKELESIQKTYLADIPSYQEQTVLVETLMKYYEQKLRILERLAYEIEKQQIYENRTLEYFN
ncbi:MAG: hypothetical protein HRU40_01120 [Saprospiraceae bacterium]|nr:hypothetical protein [Saprospiraceae bacterium]